MTVIASKAGCSLETLYTAYPNKEAMFGALITRKALGTFDAMGPLSPDRDLREGPSEVRCRDARHDGKA